MAMSDIPDDAEFLKEIEDLNKSNGVSRSNSNRSDAGSGYDDELLEEDENIDDGEDQIVWMTVRRAALCIREILRTEISYRDHMTRLFQAETTNPTAPNALLAHLPALISASKTLAGRFEEDPSVCGVSAAFLSTENELEQAMVSWSKVVGEVMIEFAKSNLVASESVPKRSESNKSVVSRVRIRPRPASMDPAVNDSQRNGRLNVFGAGRSKDLTAQDIAIMPTQRAPRYVMHFRDLLHHTPATSPSRALVERALEAAIRLARNCNQAQEHTSLIAGVQRSS
ncbi:hypothetical protein FRC02_011777 [Tulasnella sp. 418]|nr:hypothetical protein FRC02_011777 [Tulasnella sp. 418]